MDKNQAIGFSLIMLILLGWSILNRPSQEELERQRREKEKIEASIESEVTKIQKSQDSARGQADIINTNDSIFIENQKAQFGDFAAATVGSSQDYVLENEDLTIVFNNKGGRIKEVTLKNYQREIKDENREFSKIPLKLLEDDKNRFSYTIPLRNGTIKSEDLFFKGSVEGNAITFRAQAGNGYIEQKYTVAPSGFNIDYDVNFVGLQNIINPSVENIHLTWENYLTPIEVNKTFERINTTVYFKEMGEDSDYCSCRSDDTEESEEGQVEWISNANQFFNSTLISKDKIFQNGQFESKLFPEESEDLKLLTSNIDLKYEAGSDVNYAMEFYIGPNKTEELKAYNMDLEYIIPYGRSIFGSINRHIIRPFFSFLTKYIPSKGVAIIVLIFIIKMLLYPLYYKMLFSQAKMGALKPELDQIKAKNKGDAQKIQMASMKLYQEYQVSPFGGCLPMVVQMPIWYALFRFFPADITFRQEPFLWARDLSSYDAFFKLPFEIPFLGDHISLFTILWAVSTVIYTYYNTRNVDLSANPAMKYVQYFMPLMFLVFFNNYASGLTCYMFFSNFFNILQTVITKNFVFDNDKIRAELEEQKKKPKKKGGFQARLEEAMKQQQRIAEDKKKKRS